LYDIVKSKINDVKVQTNDLEIKSKKFNKDKKETNKILNLKVKNLTQNNIELKNKITSLEEEIKK
jgi:hypothetical protein